MNAALYSREGNNQPVMSREALGREQCYRIAIAMAKRLRTDGVINSADYKEIDRLMIARFRPVLAGLYPEKESQS